MVEKNKSIIGTSMVISGAVKSSGRVIVKGRVDGEFTCDTAIIDKSGRVAGEIAAREIECFGKMEGTFVLDKFVMRKGGCHFGTLVTGELEVDPGAIIDCALQSSVSTVPEDRTKTEKYSRAKEVNFDELLLAFDERERCCLMDVPWSERQELLGQLKKLLHSGKQLIKITGAKGCGKTSLTKKLAGTLGSETRLLRISDPVGSVKDLLTAVAAVVDVTLKGEESSSKIVEMIKAEINKSASGTKRTVLTIDDAHTMYPATMEGVISCLTNAYGGGEGLLQVILVATDEIEGKLVHTTREYFEDETNCLLTLEPLNIKDTAEYIRFCLQLAAKDDLALCQSLFPFETIKKMHSRSRGNIKEINRLAVKALLAAAKEGVNEIAPHFIK